MNCARQLIGVNAADHSDVRKVYKVWLEHYHQFLDAYDHVKSIITSEARNINIARLGDLKKFKIDMESYFLSYAKRETVIADNVSFTGRSSLSHKSRSSTTSAASKLLLDELQKNAEVAA